MRLKRYHRLIVLLVVVVVALIAGAGDRHLMAYSVESASGSGPVVTIGTSVTAVKATPGTGGAMSQLALGTDGE